MLGSAKRRELGRPVVVLLEDLVLLEHFCRHLDALLDLSFVSNLVRDAYPRLGRLSVDPAVFF